MSVCPECNEPVPMDSKYCPECGAPITHAPSSAPGEKSADSDDVLALLSGANVYRLRGDFPNAIKACMDALALCKESQSAYSLLGDIYRDEGKAEEAAHWYRLALDLDPDSSVDKSKLNDLISHAPLPVIPEIEPASEPPSGRKPAWSWFLSGALILLFLVLSVTRMAWRPPESGNQRERKPYQAVHQSVQVPTTPESPSEAEPPAIVRLSASESAMVDALNERPALERQRIRVVHVEEDPRTRGLTITYSDPISDSDETATQALLRDGLLVAREACLARSTIDSLVLRALLTTKENSVGGVEIAFVGNTSRDKAMSANPATTPYPSLLPLIENPWWNSRIR